MAHSQSRCAIGCADELCLPLPNALKGVTLPMDTDGPDLGLFPKRYVGKNIQGTGWRIWDRDEHKWWGRPYQEYPAELMAELNGPKRPERLAELSRNS